MPHPTSDNRSDDAVSAAATLFVVSAVQFLTPFMLSAVGVALPVIGREFAASAVQLGLVETVYIFAFSLFLIPAGRLGDIHGRKRIFTIGIVAFTAATVLISLAFSIESFIGHDFRNQRGHPFLGISCGQTRASHGGHRGVHLPGVVSGSGPFRIYGYPSGMALDLLSGGSGRALMPAAHGVETQGRMGRCKG